MLNSQFKCKPKNLFDTEIAAQILGKIARPFPDANPPNDTTGGFLGCVNRRAFAHIMIAAGIGGDQGRDQRGPDRGLFGR